MDTKRAKEVLVQQVVEQAALESVPLSDLEKRMMYFTESDPATCENPIELNDEFEAQYDTDEYERKISRLLHDAHKRLKDENGEKLRNWNEAVRILRKGDHYVLVMLDEKSELVQQGFRIWAVIAWGIGLGIALALLMVLGAILDHYGLFPRRLFWWISVPFGWMSDDPATERLQIDFIVILLAGAWFVFKLWKLGDLRRFSKGMWSGATASMRPKKRR